MIGGSLALVACLLIILTKEGIEFSDDHRSMRNYYSLLGWRYGSWEPLPTITGVTLKYFSELVNNTNSKYSWGVWNNTPNRNEKLIVMLSVQNRATGIILGEFSMDDVNSANSFAHDIAEEFAVPVHVFLPASQFRES